MSGTDVTFGTKSDFEASAVASNIAVAALSSTKVVVMWEDTTNSDGHVAVGTVSGTDVTFGAKVQFIATGTAVNRVSMLTSTKAIIT